MRLTAEEIDRLWDYEDPAGSERRFRGLLDAESGERDPAERAEVLTQLARAQGLQERFTEAHRTLDEVQRLLPLSSERVQARYLLERGRVLNSAGNPRRSAPLFREALEVAHRAGEEFYALDALHMLGIVEPMEDRLAWNLKAVELTRAAREMRARGWLGSLYNNIGWYHHEHGHLDEALRFFEEALQSHRQYGNERKVHIAQWCVARGLRSLGRVEEALRIQQELALELERSGRTDPHVYEELVECLTALGRTSEADTYRDRLRQISAKGAQA